MDQSATVQSIFEAVQYGQNHSKLMKNLQKLQETMSDEEFWEKFIHCVQCLLIIDEKHSSVDCSLKFVSKFAAASKKAEEEDADFVGEYKTTSSQDFIAKLLRYLLQIHEVDNHTVRMRVCQIIGILLQSLDDEVLDDDLFNDLTKALLSRLKDKIAVVRAEAVIALSRLQTPDDKECTIIKEYLFHLKSDPCVEVRKNILSCISASIQTLAAVVERVRDVKDSIRKAAFQFLAERVHIKCLTIAQRVQLLEEGLRDRSAMVVKTVKTKLIPAWINFSNDSILTLLKYLDVENSQEVSNLVLSSYFQMSKMDDLIKVLESIQESKVIPAKDLNCENAFYWKALVQHINSQPDTADDYLEKITPQVQVFYEYIKNYIENAPSDEEVDQHLQHEFISEQLISLISAYDAADGTARQCLLKLIRNLLQLNNLNSTLVVPLIENLAKIFQNEESLVIFCMEIIADITEPILPSSSTKNEKEIEEDKMKLAKLQVELNISKDELEQAVKEQEFGRAKELKQKIQELLQEQQHLTACPDITIIQDPEALMNDPNILLKCLIILSNLLQNIKNMNSNLFTLKDSFLLPGIQNADPAVRNESLKSLILFCLLSKEAASQHMSLLVQIAQLDLQAIRILALKGIFDLLLMFGVDVFQPSADEEKNVNAEENELGDEENDLQTDSGNGDSIISVLVNMLDNNESEVSTVVVEGLCKLLLFHRIMSSKLLSRLMLLWYNPTSDDNAYLKAVLGNFFVSFASSSRAHQECLEESFIPTLSTLWNAPSSSPLAEVDSQNVIHFMVELLRPEVVNNKHQVKLESSLHDSLALKLANEILSNPDSSFVYLLSKALSRLSFTSTNSSTIKDLSSLALQMQQKVTDPANVKQLKKFYESVSKLNGDISLNLKRISLSDTNGEPTDLEENLSDDLKKRKKLLSMEKQILLEEENSNESGIQINITQADDADENTKDRLSRSDSCSTEEIFIESEIKQTTGKKKGRKSSRSSNIASLGATGRKVKLESSLKTPCNAKPKEFFQSACSSRPRRSQRKKPVYVIDSASDSDLYEDSKMDDSIMNNSGNDDVTSQELEKSEKENSKPSTRSSKSTRKLSSVEEKKPVRYSKRLTFSAKKQNDSIN